MATTILSTKGQVVIPLALREKLGLLPGSKMEVAIVGNALMLSPAEDWQQFRGMAKGLMTMEEVMREKSQERKLEDRTLGQSTR